MVCKDIVSNLHLVGYDYVIPLEHEEGLISSDEGVKKGLNALHEMVIVENPGEMFWA